jgi:hypothetical protein
MSIFKRTGDSSHSKDTVVVPTLPNQYHSWLRKHSDAHAEGSDNVASVAVSKQQGEDTLTNKTKIGDSSNDPLKRIVAVGEAVGEAVAAASASANTTHQPTESSTAVPVANSPPPPPPISIGVELAVDDHVPTSSFQDPYRNEHTAPASSSYNNDFGSTGFGDGEPVYVQRHTQQQANSTSTSAPGKRSSLSLKNPFRG